LRKFELYRRTCRHSPISKTKFEAIIKETGNIELKKKKKKKKKKKERKKERRRRRRNMAFVPRCAASLDCQFLSP
jgi:hypothetical protein